MHRNTTNRKTLLGCVLALASFPFSIALLIWSDRLYPSGYVLPQFIGVALIAVGPLVVFWLLYRRLLLRWFGLLAMLVGSVFLVGQATFALVPAEVRDRPLTQLERNTLSEAAFVGGFAWLLMVVLVIVGVVWIIVHQRRQTGTTSERVIP